MSRPPLVLTGPQAIAIGVAAGLAWTYRQTLRAAGRVIKHGPCLSLCDDDDADWDAFVAANPLLFNDPPSSNEHKE